MKTASLSGRVASIDVFRALTMFLMIFVNDFWGVSGIPHWLEHAGAGEDMLGFSDLIFPSFLFILGMSIPFAIENRIRKGESKLIIIKHIAFRSIALLVMGVFAVNYESLDNSVMNRYLFSILMVTGFFLIWNIYPKKQNWSKYLFKGLQILGILILVFLAIFYSYKTGKIMQPKWWGILGLIGWTYLVCALIYLFIRQNLKYLTVAWLFFVLICIAEANQWLGVIGGIIPGKGAFHAFTMGGLILSLLFNRFSFKKLLAWTVALGFILLIFGWISNHFWIISKLSETPPWLFYCSGISVLAYIVIYWLVEQNGKSSWFSCIKPAGTATLTCYLIPYWLYAIFIITHFSLPAAWLAFPVGLLKCILISFLSIWIAYGLGKIGIKLKI
jgi:predicted acyltransferase